MLGEDFREIVDFREPRVLMNFDQLVVSSALINRSTNCTVILAVGKLDSALDGKTVGSLRRYRK